MGVDIFGIGSAIQGAAALASTVTGAVQARKKRIKGEALEREGRNLTSTALANRKKYEVAPEVQQQYDRALNDLSAKSAVQSAMEARADAGSSNVLSAISRNSTSGAGAIAAAQAAEAQRGSAYQGAALAGAQERNSRLDRLDAATGLLAEKKDTAYDINEQQMFEREYNRAQDMIGAGYNGQLAGQDQLGNAITSGLSAAGSIAGASNWNSDPEARAMRQSTRRINRGKVPKGY